MYAEDALNWIECKFMLYIIKISREKNLLLVPFSSSDVSVVQWPPFLLASKVKQV